MISSRIIRRIALVALAALFVFGCGGSPKPEPAPPPPQETAATRASLDEAKTEAATPAASKEAAAPERPAPPKVRLLDAGGSPRQPLRYRFAVGPSQWLQMDLKMTMAMTAGDKVGAPVKLPTIRNIMRIDPKSVSSEGELRYEFELTKTALLRDVPIKDDMRAQLELDLSTLVGFKGKGAVNARGIGDEDFVVPSDAPQNVQDAMENLRNGIRQFWNPLPEEPVGKGAKWEVETAVDTPAIHMTQTSTYTLRDLRSGRAVMALSLVQSAPRQPMKLKRVVGANVELEGMQGTGDGNVELTFDKLGARSFAKIANESRMLVTAKDGSLRMIMNMGLEIRNQPAK